MSDMGHDWTDEQIAELSRRFEKEYAKAADEMAKKLKSALADYERENSQRLKALDGTEESKRLYEEWKRSQLISQRWLEDMAHQLSESAANSNMHAADMINDCLPRVYSENSNMAAFALEKRLGYDVGFTLVNEDAIRHLMGMPAMKAGDDQLLREVTDTPEEARKHVQDLRKRQMDYPKDMRWNRERFHSAITQGILQGESIPNIVKRTKDIYGRNKAAATRAARTATTNAENAGRMNTFERAQKLGIDMEIEWLATPDGRTRDSHRALDGERIQLGQKFSNGLRWPADPYGPASEIWNCFVGDTKAVPLGELQRSFRRFYDGDAVTVITASGVNFTCTPNHPILTSKGWVAAGLLDDSYDLFVADLGNGLDGSGVKPDVEHVGTSLEAIHELISVSLGNRASSLGVYFHEDVLTSDVDVVTEERSLRVNQETLGLEPIDEIGLELPDTLAPSNSPEVEFVGTSMTASDSLVSSGSKPRALLGSGIRHALEHGLRTVSWRDSSPLESDVYDVSTNTEVLGESLDALSAVIKLDHVVNVDIHPISAHVYNLQTESGAYLVNNNDSISAYVIAHNCRCRANGRVVGFDGKRGDWVDEKGERWTRLPKGMTYDEWKKAKAVSREESYKNLSNILSGFWNDADKQTSGNMEAWPTSAVEDIGTGPIRPMRGDFDSRDEYLAARDEYRTARDEFEERKQKLIDEIVSLPDHGYTSDEAILEWAKANGVVVSDSAMSDVDRRVLDEAISALDGLLSKYPQVNGWYGKYGKSFTIGTDAYSGEFMEASGGLNISTRYNGSYRSSVQTIVDGYTTQTYNEQLGRNLRFQVRGDGTLGTTVTHEFGHNLEHAISEKFVTHDQYGDVTFTDDWDKFTKELREITAKHTTSEYSLTNHDEAFAEGFAEYERSPESDYAKAFGEFLRRWL